MLQSLPPSSYNLFLHILCLHVSICYILSSGLIFSCCWLLLLSKWKWLQISCAFPFHLVILKEARASLLNVLGEEILERTLVDPSLWAMCPMLNQGFGESWATCPGVEPCLPKPLGMIKAGWWAESFSDHICILISLSPSIPHFFPSFNSYCYLS